MEGILWGDRRAYFTHVHGELVLKAEVASAAEAERMIHSGIVVEGKKYEVRAWTKEIKGKGEAAAPSKLVGGQGAARGPVGRWQAGAPSLATGRQVPGGPRPPLLLTPTEPAAMRGGGITQGGGKASNGGTRGMTKDAPRGRMLSNVRCYRCGLMGHLQYTCTFQSRRAVAGVQDGRGILPVPAHMSEKQKGKRPATDIP